MKWYSIGEFAAKTGVTPDFIKYYEKNNLLKPRVSENGYRSYTAVRVSNVSECIKLKNMGFSAKEISLLLTNTDFQTTVDLLTGRRGDFPWIRRWNIFPPGRAILSSRPRSGRTACVILIRRFMCRCCRRPLQTALLPGAAPVAGKAN